MITGTLALLIFDRNLILMLYPVITCIWSISVSQKCESLWPGRKSLRQKNLKKMAKTFTSGNRPTSTKFSINYQTKNQNYPYWITGLEKLVYLPGKWPDCIFLHLLIQSFWVPCEAKISVKKNPTIWSWDLCIRICPECRILYHLPQSFWGSWASPSCKDHLASEVGVGLIWQPNKFWDNLHFDLGCPNDY
jgi:hypothetical protein